MAGKALLGMQRSHGNAVVSRIASGTAVARRTKRDAGESVGAEPGEAQALPPAPGEKGELELGEKGYTLQMLTTVPRAAGKAFALYEEEHLEPVKVTLTKLDTKTLPELSTRLREANDRSGDFWNTPSTTKTWHAGPSTTRPSWTCSSPTARARSSSSRTTTRACRGRTRCSCRWPGSRRCSRCSA